MWYNASFVLLSEKKLIYSCTVYSTHLVDGSCKASAACMVAVITKWTTDQESKTRVFLQIKQVHTGLKGMAYNLSRWVVQQSPVFVRQCAVTPEPDHGVKAVWHQHSFFEFDPISENEKNCNKQLNACSDNMNCQYFCSTSCCKVYFHGKYLEMCRLILVVIFWRREGFNRSGSSMSPSPTSSMT